MHARNGAATKGARPWTDADWEGSYFVKWSNHKKGAPEGLNAVYADGHVTWYQLARTLWWGPFPGYNTTKRCLVPPGSETCYVGENRTPHYK